MENWYDCDLGEVKETEKRIKVVGIGGGGGNTLNSLYKKFMDPSQNLSMDGIDFIIINSDSQDLTKSPIPNKIQIAEDGQGAGSDPQLGKEYAEKHEQRISDALRKAYMIFITAGMGGGTGTGAAPVVARLARKANPGALIIGVVTTPFTSTRNVKKMQVALEGIEKLKTEVNALLIVSNDSIMKLFPNSAMYEEALRATDKVLMNAITGIVGIIKNVGNQNADFRDVYNIMKEAGTDVIIGVGSATGPDRYQKALDDALNSPLLCSRTINGARGIIVNFCTSKGKSDLNGVNYVRNSLYALADPKASYKDCTTEDKSMGDMLMLTVIATDFVDERGNYVTYMNRVVAEQGIKTARNDNDSEEKEKEEEVKESVLNVKVPDFSIPTFIRAKRR